MRKSISVIIPTYNGLHLLKKNLPAVLGCLQADDQIVVVDDASQDQTVIWLTDVFTQIAANKGITLTVIQNPHNLRFGAAVNKGVKEATHELLFVLNNDVSPKEDVLAYLVPHFDDPLVFAVGCKEVEKNTNTIGGKNKLWFERGLFIHSRADEFSSGPTAWASGGSALFSKSKWQELGGFDKAYYPAYWEDIDLSFRARQRGWKVLFEANAVVDHNHETTNSDVFGSQGIARMSWRNAHRFVWRNGTAWQKLANILWRPYWFIKQL